MLFWGIGMGLLGLAMMIILPNVGFLKQFEKLLTNMPAVIKALGMDDAAQMATPEGFISAGYFGRILLFMAVYVVLAGLNITANEEDQGIMDMLLSLPLDRTRLILEKFTAYSLMFIVIVGMGFLGLCVGGLAAAIPFDAVKLWVASINVVPAGLFMLSFTLFAGVFLRRRSQAAALSAAFIIASYILDFAAGAASGSLIARLRGFSFFAYYDNAHVMQNGLNAGHITLLLLLASLLVAASLRIFQRRDIGV